MAQFDLRHYRRIDVSRRYSLKITKREYARLRNAVGGIRMYIHQFDPHTRVLTVETAYPYSFAKLLSSCIDFGATTSIEVLGLNEPREPHYPGSFMRAADAIGA